MKTMISENKSYFIPLLLLLVGVIFPLLLVSKASSFFFINGHYSRFSDFIFTYWTYLGNGYVYLVILIFFLAKKDYKITIIVIGIALLQALISTLLKQVIFPDAWRPAKELSELASQIHFIEGVKIHRYHSFPSGHTATAFAASTLLALVSKNKNYSWVFLFFAIGVAWSRVYLAQHFLVDVYFGAITGAVSAMIIYGWINYKTPAFVNKWIK